MGGQPGAVSVRDGWLGGQYASVMWDFLDPGLSVEFIKRLATIGRSP